MYTYMLCLYISDLGKKYYCKEDEREYGNKCYTMFLQPSNFLNNFAFTKWLTINVNGTKTL